MRKVFVLFSVLLHCSCSSVQFDSPNSSNFSSRENKDTSYAQSLGVVKGPLGAGNVEYYVSFLTNANTKTSKITHQRISIFPESSREIIPLDSVIVSVIEKGKFDSIQIENNQIKLIGKKCAPSDFKYAPSLPASTTYELRNDKLIHVQGDYLAD